MLKDSIYLPLDITLLWSSNRRVPDVSINFRLLRSSGRTVRLVAAPQTNSLRYIAHPNHWQQSIGLKHCSDYNMLPAER